VDTDGSASLLLGLMLSVDSLLLSDHCFQRVGLLLELLLVCVMEFVHVLGEHPVHHLIAAGVLGGRLVYHGDYFSQ